MKLSSHKRLRRRDLFQWIGGAAMALPCLELFERDARAQAGTKSKFAVFCYTPDGVNENAFWPTGTPASYQLTNTILSPFEPFKDKPLQDWPPIVAAGLVAQIGHTAYHLAAIRQIAQVVRRGG